MTKIRNMDELIREIFTNQEIQHLGVYSLSMDLLVPMIHAIKCQSSMDGPIPSIQIQATKHILSGSDGAEQCPSQTKTQQ
jgi:hypothetical protein